MIIAQKEAFAANVGEVVAGRTMELIKNGFIKPVIAPVISFGVGELGGYMRSKMKSFAEVHTVAAGDVPYDETNPMHKGKGKLKEKEPAGPTGAWTGPAKPKPELTQEDIDFLRGYKPPTFGSSSSSSQGLYKSREEVLYSSSSSSSSDSGREKVLGFVVPPSPYPDFTTGRAPGIGISLIPEAYGDVIPLNGPMPGINLSVWPLYETAAALVSRGLLGVASFVASNPVALGLGAITAAGCCVEAAGQKFYQDHPLLDPEFDEFLTNPAIPEAEKQKQLTKAFSDPFISSIESLPKNLGPSAPVVAQTVHKTPEAAKIQNIAEKVLSTITKAKDTAETTTMPPPAQTPVPPLPPKPFWVEPKHPIPSIIDDLIRRASGTPGLHEPMPALWESSILSRSLLSPAEQALLDAGITPVMFKALQPTKDFATLPIWSLTKPEDHDTDIDDIFERSKHKDKGKQKGKDSLKPTATIAPGGALPPPDPNNKNNDDKNKNKDSDGKDNTTQSTSDTTECKKLTKAEIFDKYINEVEIGEKVDPKQFEYENAEYHEVPTKGKSEAPTNPQGRCMKIRSRKR